MSSGRLAALRRQALLEHIPLAVSLELTARCNHRCLHCYLPQPPPADRLGTDRLLVLLDELAELGTLHLTLTGGEPLLRPDWLEVARRARQLGFQVNLLSNASLISERVADQIAALHCTVEATLFSLDSEVFERLAGIPGSFSRTLSGIERLLERGVRLHLKVPVTHLNRLDFVDVLAFARERGAFARADTRILPRRDGNLEPVVLRIDERELEPYMRHLGVEPEASCEGDAEGPPCAAGASSACISSEGWLLGCPALPGADQSLLEQPFADAWTASSWLAELRAVRTRPTSPLPYRGHCHVQALLEQGGLDRPTDWAERHGELVARLGG